MRIAAQSAALIAGGAHGWRVRQGQQAGPRDGTVIVIFGEPGDLVGWTAADGGYPSADLLPRVNHYPAPERRSRNRKRREGALQ
jgi:hypothetical protein